MKSSIALLACCAAMPLVLSAQAVDEVSVGVAYARSCQPPCGSGIGAGTALQGDSILLQGTSPRKSPVLAAALSVVLPGLGQAYNGQWLKGAAFLGGVASGAAFIVVGGTCALVLWGSDPPDCDPGALLTIGQILMIGSWVGSVIDAPLASIRINKEASSRRPE
jgi:hypothetical protein